MISNEKMEQLWWKYRNEGVAKNLSMQAFCSLHNVPYNAFEKYLKLRRHFSDVHHVTITDAPSEAASKEVPIEKTAANTAAASTATDKSQHPSETTKEANGDRAVRIMINVRISNGIQISKKNIDYRTLRSLVEKLEVLC